MQYTGDFREAEESDDTRIGRADLDLPDPFVVTPEFEVDSRLIERWAELTEGEFEQAIAVVALGDLRTGLEMTNTVALEHRARAERANKLNSRLREAINRTARYGLADQNEEGVLY